MGWDDFGSLGNWESLEFKPKMLFIFGKYSESSSEQSAGTAAISTIFPQIFEWDDFFSEKNGTHS